MTAESADVRARIREAITSQKRATVTVLSSLLAAQDELGYLPDVAIDEIAVFSDTTINEVWGVASFYTNFRFTPPGKHLVEVCWGPTCHLQGAPHIVKAVLDSLGITGEGETEDRTVSLKYNTCLGGCTQAPLMSIDHQLIGRLNPDSASNAVAGLAADGS